MIYSIYMYLYIYIYECSHNSQDTHISTLIPHRQKIHGCTQHRYTQGAQTIVDFTFIHVTHVS